MIGSGAYDTVGSGAVHAVGGWAGLAGNPLAGVLPSRTQYCSYSPALWDLVLLLWSCPLGLSTAPIVCPKTASWETHTRS